MVNRKLFFVLGMLVCLTPSVFAARRADDLFQQALVKESGERDLEAAIVLYKQVVADPDVEHLVAFEARIRMGSCYERLGKIDDAEEVYRQVVKESATPQSEFAQEAQSSLRRLENQQRLLHESTAPIKPETMVTAVNEFHETRWSLSLGPAALVSGGNELSKLAASARYKLSSGQNPLPVYVELGTIAPIGPSGVMSQTQTTDSQTTDVASLRLNYQTSLALIKELPHGIQRKVIPEAGAGLALTRSDLEASSAFSGTTPATVGSGSDVKTTVSPYFTLGLHFYPDRVVSFLLQGTYTAVPYPQTLTIAPPAHNQTFDVPNALWGIQAKVQIKIGWSNILIKRKAKS